jgi:hypothetical protein
MNDTEKRELIELLKTPPVMSQVVSYDHLYKLMTVLMDKAADALEETLWQDIESAPYRDGKVFRAIVMGDQHTMVFEAGEFWDVMQNAIVGYPTHYKPLDTPE